MDKKLKNAADLLNQFAPPGERLVFVNPAEEQALKAAGGSGDAAAGGVPSYKKGDVEAPPPRNYGQETRDTLQAQVDLAPALAEAEAGSRPVYTALDLQDMNQMLTGDRSSKGLISLYREDLQPALSELEAQERQARIAGEMQAIQDYAQPVADTLRKSTGNAEILDMLNQQAKDELAAGATLDPSLRREVQQGIRAGQAARGMGYGINDLADEATLTALQADQLRRQRQAFAQSMVGINQATGGDPFMAVLGRPSQVFPAMQNVGAQGYQMSQGIGQKLYNPEGQYAADIYNQNYQGNMAARTATANNRAAMTGAAMGAIGKIGSAGVTGLFN